MAAQATLLLLLGVLIAVGRCEEMNELEVPVCAVMLCHPRRCVTPSHARPTQVGLTIQLPEMG